MDLTQISYEAWRERLIKDAEERGDDIRIHPYDHLSVEHQSAWSAGVLAAIRANELDETVNDIVDKTTPDFRRQLAEAVPDGYVVVGYRRVNPGELCLGDFGFVNCNGTMTTIEAKRVIVAKQPPAEPERDNENTAAAKVREALDEAERQCKRGAAALMEDGPELFDDEPDATVEVTVRLPKPHEGMRWVNYDCGESIANSDVYYHKWRLEPIPPTGREWAAMQKPGTVVEYGGEIWFWQLWFGYLCIEKADRMSGGGTPMKVAGSWKYWDAGLDGASDDTVRWIHRPGEGEG